MASPKIISLYKGLIATPLILLFQNVLCYGQLEKVETISIPRLGGASTVKAERFTFEFFSHIYIQLEDTTKDELLLKYISSSTGIEGNKETNYLKLKLSEKKILWKTPVKHEFFHYLPNGLLLQENLKNNFTFYD